MKIIVVNGNYPKDNKEADYTLDKQGSPVLFMKADSALLKDGKPFFIPRFTQQCSYALHVVARISRLGKSIPERFARRYYDGLTVGIDFTAQDLLEKLRAEGLPWEMSKSFDSSAVIGNFVRPEDVDLDKEHFHLEKDGETVAEGDTGHMLWRIDALIARMSEYFMLRQGDLLFMGAVPEEGIAHIGDHLTGYLGSEKLLEFNVR